MSSDSILFFRVLLALIGIGLSFGFYLYYLRGNATRKTIYTSVLILCAVFGLYLYLELGPQFHRTRVARIMNPHDFYHYYVGSKYYRELGFFDLYECSVIADQERRIVTGVRPARAAAERHTAGQQVRRQILAYE